MLNSRTQTMKIGQLYTGNNFQLSPHQPVMTLVASTTVGLVTVIAVSKRRKMDGSSHKYLHLSSSQQIILRNDLPVADMRDAVDLSNQTKHLAIHEQEHLRERRVEPSQSDLCCIHCGRSGGRHWPMCARYS